MNNKKQSSIEYFFEEVVKWHLKPWLYVSDGGLEGIYQKAKAMHKEEIVESYREGRSDQQSKEIFYHRNSEQYYKETFGGNNE